MNKWIETPRILRSYTMAEARDFINWSFSMCNIPEHWAQTQGENIVVAIIDADIIDHPDINSNILSQKNFTNEKYDSTIINANGHGLFVAGIVAARRDDNGIVGVAPKAKLRIYKALDNTGSGDPEWIAKAIDAAVEDGVDVINMSLGSPYPSDKIRDAVKRAYNKNIIIVCAAGNTGYYDGGGSTVNYPGAFPECIAVSSVGKDKNISEFSSGGPEVLISFGGEEIFSCYAEKQKPNYIIASGTSFSSPGVAGVVALALSNHRQGGDNKKTPIKNVQDMKDHLIRTAIDAGVKGKDDKYGYGIVSVDGMFEINGNDPLPDPILEPVPVPSKNLFESIIEFFKKIFRWK